MPSILGAGLLPRVLISKDVLKIKAVLPWWVAYLGLIITLRHIKEFSTNIAFLHDSFSIFITRLAYNMSTINPIWKFSRGLRT